MTAPGSTPGSRQGSTPGSSAQRQPLVIAHLSDLHLGAHISDAVESVVADVAAVRPTLTVVTGDLTMRARVPQFRAARAVLEELPAPLLVVPGNHDVPLISAARALSPYARYQRWINRDLDSVVRLPEVTALGLESTPRWRWKSGRVSRRQRESVVTVLGAAPVGVVRMVAMHHPPGATGLARVVGRGGLLQALAAARVDLLLAGHTHVPESRRVAYAGTSSWLITVVAGTATSGRTRGAGRSWSVIRVQQDAVEVEERCESADGWRTGRTTRHPRPGVTATAGGSTSCR